MMATISNSGVVTAPNLELNLVSDRDTSGYMMAVMRLSAQLLKLLATTSSDHTHSAKELKRQYTVATKESAQDQTDVGTMNKRIAMLAFFIAVPILGLVNGDDKMFARTFHDQLPQLLSPYSSSCQAQLQIHQGEASLALEQYRDKTAAKQSEGNSKQEIFALIQATKDGLLSASRGGS